MTSYQPLKIVNAQMPGAPRFWREDKPPGLGPVEYQRVVGGIGWPRMGQDGAGCWCILGEVRQPDGLTHAHAVHVLASGQDDSVASLLDSASAAASVLQCGHWVGPLNEPGFRLFIEWQANKRRLAQPSIDVSHPPSSDFGVLWELLKARTKGEKSFYFGEHGVEIAQSIKGLDAEAVTKTLTHYPTVAALLYALGVIDLEPAPGRHKRTWHRGRAGY